MSEKSPTVVTGAVSAAAAWLAVAVFATGQFVFQTAAVGSNASAVAALCAFSAAVGLLLVGGSVRPGSLKEIRAAQATAAAVLGAVAFAGAPLFVMANRFSDAPAGSLALFWTVPFAGFVLVAAHVVASRELRGLTRVAAALVALVGAAAVLANWERPSSFSLLARHVSQQLALGVSALVWAAALVALVILAEKYGRRAALGWAALGSLGAAVILAATGAPAVPSVLGALFAAPLALFVAGATASTVYASRRWSPALAGSALLMVPAALTLFTFVEAAVGALGPRPVLLDAAFAATCVGAVGAYGAVRSGSERVRASWLVLAPAVAAALIAVAAMVVPGVAVAVRGARTDMQAFSANFTLSGAETIGGWLVFSLALFLLLETVLQSRSSVRRSVGTVLIAITVAAGWAILRFVPLHVWVSWIPAEVQQDYGTEYASITYSAVSTAVQIASLAASVIAAGALMVSALRGRPGREATEGQVS